MYEVHVRHTLTSYLNSRRLPIKIESFRKVPEFLRRSHIQLESKTYNIEGTSGDEDEATARQRKHKGNSITEGVYCSLERLRQAPGGPSEIENAHRWDMMTRSDARGSTRFAPWSIKRKETLEAIAKDVQYVLEYIRKRRMAARGITEDAS
jgi:hypothetical protein